MQLSIPARSSTNSRPRRQPPYNLVSLNKKWYETDSYKDVREIDILEDKKGEDPTVEQDSEVNDLMRHRDEAVCRTAMSG